MAFNRTKLKTVRWRNVQAEAAGFPTWLANVVARAIEYGIPATTGFKDITGASGEGYMDAKMFSYPVAYVAETAVLIGGEVCVSNEGGSDMLTGDLYAALGYLYDGETVVVSDYTLIEAPITLLVPTATEIPAGAVLAIAFFAGEGVSGTVRGDVNFKYKDA